LLFPLVRISLFSFFLAHRSPPPPFRLETASPNNLGGGGEAARLRFSYTGPLRRAKTSSYVQINNTVW
jgi:hypothetical protein